MPAWLRGLIWTDRSPSFDAFLSYSWKADSGLAPIIQNILQSFLRPWYKLRALNIFRDLSALAASSNLEMSLKAKLDHSHHLIVLACPEAKASKGMEFEASYWLSKPRQGQVLIVVTGGKYGSWKDIRESALPPVLEERLLDEPLWIDISGIRANAGAVAAEIFQTQLTDALHQLILVFYPGKSWSQLQGEESLQRRKAIRLAVSSIVLLFTLLVAVVISAILARNGALRSRGAALVLASSSLSDPLDKSLALSSIESAENVPDIAGALRDNAREAVPGVVLRRQHGQISGIAYDSNGDYLATASLDGSVLRWRADGRGEPIVLKKRDAYPVSSLSFSDDGQFLMGLRGPYLWVAHSDGALAAIEQQGQNCEFYMGSFDPQGTHVTQWAGEMDCNNGAAYKSVFLNPNSSCTKIVSSLEWLTFDAGTTENAKLTANAPAQLQQALNSAAGVAPEPVRADSNSAAGTGILSPDRKLIASYDLSESMLTIKDASSGRFIRSMSLAPAPRSMAWSPTGTQIAVGKVDGTIGIVSISTGQVAEMIEGAGGPLSQFAWSPDGQRLAAALETGLILIYDVERREMTVKIFDDDKTVRDLTWSPDSRLITAGGFSGPRTWDAGSGKLLSQAK